MRDFAELLERLALAPSLAARIALIGRYFTTVADPDRGFGLAILAGGLRLPSIRPGLVRSLAAARTDPVLLALSCAYVGDLAETVALLWPTRPDGGRLPGLADLLGTLATTPKSALPDLLAGWLDVAEPPERYVLLKLLTGGLRAQLSGPLAREALAAWGRLDPAVVDEVWHGLAPPYTALFAWASGRAPRPDLGDAPLFRPLMRAHAIGAPELAALDPAAYRAEWAWDGIRVQLVAMPGGRRVFSHNADDLSALFPEIVAALDAPVVLGGMLLAFGTPPELGADRGTPAPFAALQRRLNRPAPSAALRRDFPVGVRLHDMLFDGGEDVRALGFDARRARLDAWFARAAPAGMDLSPPLAFADAADLARLRAAGAAAGSAGLLLKRCDSPYLAGRPREAWWECKHEPQRIDAVLMYAKVGPDAGGRGDADYTFGVWDGAALVPVGKAGAGISEAERRWLDGWIHEHTIARFGPVREVEKALVLEVAFDSAQPSPRPKAGVALRCPRITGLRRDKEAAAVERLEAVLGLVGQGVARREVGSAGGE